MGDEAVPPSSFDEDFYKENRWQKLGRRLKEEPLVPLGCAATCYALYRASRAIRAGDHELTNRMFRARIYAQGFTLLTIVAGGMYYKKDREKRGQFEKALKEKKAQEKREKWIRELEARDAEEKELKRMKAAIERAKGTSKSKEMTDQAKPEVKGGVAKSVGERVVWRQGRVACAIRDLLQGKQW